MRLSGNDTCIIKEGCLMGAKDIDPVRLRILSLCQHVNCKKVKKLSCFF